MPNLSVSPGGTVFAMWYDARESASCTKGNPALPCYRMWARKSNDNGATCLADMTFSDVVTPLPAQPDPSIVAEYVGDYDYGSAGASNHVSSWADGRVTSIGCENGSWLRSRQGLLENGMPACCLWPRCEARWLRQTT
jgi:hypothetical protein